MPNEETKQVVDQLKTMIEASEGKLSDAIKEKIVEVTKSFNDKSIEMQTELTEAIEAAKSMGEEVRKIKEEMSRKPAEEQNLFEQIEKQLSEKLGEKSVSERAEIVRSGLALELKAAGNITISGNVTGNDVARVSIVNEWDVAPLRRTTFRDMLPVVTVNAETERVVEQYNRDGDAAFTAEGVTAPLVDFDMKTTDYPAQEVKAMTSVSERALGNITMLSDAIYSNLRQEMAIVEENKILYGAGSGSNEPDGVTTTASAFTLTAMSTASPTNEDCINAALTQLETLNHMGNFVAMNPIDYGNMKIEKDSNGRPIISADKPGIGGLPVIKTNAITAGSLLVGDMDKMKLRNATDLKIVMGYNLTGDFGKSIISIRATREIIFYVPTQNQNAFVYDTFENIKSAITEEVA